MNPAIKLSIVIGVQHAQENVAQIVRALAPALHPEVELLFCHTAADPDVPALVGAQGRIRVVSGPARQLDPASMARWNTSRPRRASWPRRRLIAFRPPVGSKR